MIHVAGLFKKSDFLQTNGYDSNMKSGYEDWELWINMLKTGGNAINVDTATLFYRTKQQSRMTGIDYKKGYLLKAYIYHKHRELYNDLIAKQYLEININFLYSFYLSAKIYKHDNIKTLKKYFNNKLKKELNQYSFFLKKKILFGWFLKNKIGITLIDVLFR